MGGQANAAPVIIKRKKVVVGGGHHGGAWKVAYADFVTAMMAFFLLMWLLNATTEQQRKGLADFFSPSIPISRTSGGGVGAFGGESILSENDLQSAEFGASENSPAHSQNIVAPEMSDDTNIVEPEAIAAEIEARLRALSGESMAMERALRHIVTRVTDEGLVVEIFDLPGSSLFETDSAMPTETLRALAGVVGEMFALVSNELAVHGHVRSYPITLIDNPAWDLSQARGHAMRGLLEGAALQPERMQRVTGFADRKTVTPDPMLARNNRVEVVLLRFGK